MTETTSPDALDIAAKATGLRPDQIRRAVEEYRAAAHGIEAEPEWRAIMHMSGGTSGIAQFGAETTKVVLQIDSWKERGQWRQERRYIFGGRAFELFAEARAVELRDAAKLCLYAVEKANAAT